ncbi:unnamed protein product, partial [Vitis vinifera]|uniref:Uncharacterized protein n=1 Tax=Vitis vinifera TaxID=29760 RepID=D7SQN3_VITVI
MKGNIGRREGERKRARGRPLKSTLTVRSEGDYAVFVFDWGWNFAHELILHSIPLINFNILISFLFFFTI